jgi:hypothetical protein
MFWELFEIIGSDGETSLNIEFLTRIIIFMLLGLILIVGGFTIRREWGALIAIIIGAFLFLYGNGLLPL